MLDETVQTRPETTVHRGTRSDIQALRALAVGAVTLFHLWPNRLTGGFVGVDVFFVISGFLITSHLLRRPPRTGGDLATFWARRVRRLLPASYLVLAAAFVGTLLFVPDTLWAGTIHEVVASALYVENWSLASQSVDYLAAENAPSAVQHYWSLSVEEQFYLFWPLLLLVAGVLARRHRATSGAALGAITAVGVASLSVSMLLTASEPASAYFVTPTRIWELATGGLVAALLAHAPRALRWPDPVRVAAAWTGLAAIGIAVVTYTNTTPFPGWTAALPVGGTALVIAADARRTAASPLGVMSWKPVQWLGDVSYSVYLWHWPLIVIAPYALSRPLGTVTKIAILVATLGLATLTKALVEDRFRRGAARPRTVLLLAGTASLATLTLGLTATHFLDARAQERQQAIDQALSGGDPCLGAGSIDTTCDATATVLTASDAKADKPSAYADDCWESPPFHDTATCRYGSPEATTRIALIGNSHAANWLPALQELATANSWSITTYLASQCPVTATRIQFNTSAKSTGCLAWGERVRAAVADGDFDLVVTSQLTPFPAEGVTGARSDQLISDGYRDYLASLLDTGTRVLVIRDTPYPKHTLPSVPDCVAEYGAGADECTGNQSSWLPSDPLYDAARTLDTPRLSTVDLTRYFCTDGKCPAEIGGVVVYFDASHLTATYSRSLASALAPTVRTALAS